MSCKRFAPLLHTLLLTMQFLLNALREGHGEGYRAIRSTISIVTKLARRSLLKVGPVTDLITHFLVLNQLL
jgi:hypothetical protein